MVYLFGRIVWIFGHTITKIPSQFRWRPFFFFFFFFFFFGEHLHLDRKTVQTFFFWENTSIWAEKTASILTEKHNASSHFSGKSLLPPQIILSSYGHDKDNSTFCLLMHFGRFKFTGSWSLWSDRSKKLYFV